MIRRLVLSLTLPALALAAPGIAPAGADAIVYYTPPHLLKQGKNTSPVAGNGTVVVKVLVNADGTFKVQNVIRSTNHRDDAAALEIARSSTYQAASRGPKKQLAFYDFTLKFSGGSAASTSDGPGGGAAAGGATGELGKYETELRAANYTAAQTSLKTYVAAHPDDPKGQLDLGVADTYLNDYAGGAAAFDKAGNVPAAYKAVASKAYVENAIALLGAKDLTNGLPAAKRAADFDPGFVSLDTLGVAQLESGDAASAVTSLEKAHGLGAASNVSNANRASNDVHLVQAYLATGDLTNAQKIGTEATGLDPKAAANVASATSNYYATKAQDAGKAGKYAESGATYEEAAAANPSQAAVLYVAAAFAYLKATPDALSDKAQAAAEKAIAIAPSDAAANYADGIALANKGKKSEATAALEKAESLAKAAGTTSLLPEIDHALRQLNSGAGS